MLIPTKAIVMYGAILASFGMSEDAIAEAEDEIEVIEPRTF